MVFAMNTCIMVNAIAQIIGNIICGERFSYVDSHAHLDELIYGNFYGRRYEFDYNGFDFPPNYKGVVANIVFPQHFKHTSDVLNLSSNIYGTVGLHPKY